MQLVFWIILVFHISISSCFVLGTSNTTSNIHSLHEFQQILALFNNEKQSINLLVGALELKLNDIDKTLNQRINNTEEEMKKLNTELRAEKTRRIQLQKDNDELTLKFYNLSVEYNLLRNRTHSLQGENINLNTTVQNLTKVVLASNNDVSSIKINLTQFAELKKTQGNITGFTATKPKDGPSLGTINFQSLLSNTGNHYSLTTGKFTCGVDGVYFFSVTIVKESTADHAWCYIRKNGQNLVQAGVQREDSWNTGWYGATNSAILHLQSGDIVDLGGCSPANTTYSDSTFTGFLIKAI